MMRMASPKWDFRLLAHWGSLHSNREICQGYGVRGSTNVDLFILLNVDSWSTVPSSYGDIKYVRTNHETFAFPNISMLEEDDSGAKGRCNQWSEISCWTCGSFVMECWKKKNPSRFTSCLKRSEKETVINRLTVEPETKSEENACLSLAKESAHEND